MPRRGVVRFALWTALLVVLTALVQARLFATLDEPFLWFIAAHRPLALTEAMNWFFRLGYVQVDAIVALIAAAYLLIARQSALAALAPLVLFAAIGVQGGLRLVIKQPSAESAFAIRRVTVSQTAVSSVDRADATVRQTLSAASATLGASAQEQGSYPSGHACRALFLALLARNELGQLKKPKSWRVRQVLLSLLVLLAGLVGYSAMFFGYHWPSDVLAGYLLALMMFEVARCLTYGA